MPIQYNLVDGEPITFDYDPDSKEVFTVVLRPDTWSAGKETIQNNSIIIPSTPNGCMYIPVQGGITGTVEPTTWKTAKGSITESGTVKFKAVPYSLRLQTGDTLTAVEVIKPLPVILDNEQIIDGKAFKFRIESLNTGDTPLRLTLRCTILRDSSLTVIHDISILLNLTTL
jgi:hypothetical protein